ncbi:MAG: RAMP superfamily CRISPR-associated protein [Roseiflexaceae bacterium]
MSDWNESRNITRRLVVHGELILASPAHFGTGERGDLTDMDLARDALSGAPLLPGSSIAGALRAALLQRQHGYGADRAAATAAALLFGGDKGEAEGAQSPLIIDDALASQTASTVRDRVKIEHDTRTASDGAKFDIELIPAGTTFPLRFELLISANHDSAVLVQALATVLTMLEQGEIRLGARRTRGLGRCHAGTWRISEYAVGTPAGMLAWLRATDAAELAVPPHPQIAAALGITTLLSDQRQMVTLEVRCAVDGAMLVRAPAPLRRGSTPDVIQLSEGGQLVIPGSSIAGALRARAARILSVVAPDVSLVEKIFGPAKIEDTSSSFASRLLVDDATITAATELVQMRVSIDRFTGGSYDGALFAEQPSFGGTTTLRLILRCDHEVDRNKATGLLLLLLKDLWTGDLPLGGSSSIGRGRLRGLSAALTLSDGSTLTLTNAPDLGLTPEDRQRLQGFVDALNQWEVTA